MFNKNTIKDVLNLALPAVGEMILYMMIWVFDTMMVGRYGGNLAVSTVGLSSEIMYTFTNVFIAVGISVGITSLVARRYGAKEYEKAEEYATIGFAVGAIIAFSISLILFVFSKNILRLAGADNNVIYYGSIFMKITSVGIFFNMIMSLLNSILRGYGNTKNPLFASIFINIINIGLDYVLIFGKFGFPELGTTGSAIATATAQTLGFVFIAIYVKKYSKIRPGIKYIEHLKLNKVIELFKLSIPSSLQEAAFDTARLLSSFMIMHIGNIAFASNQIATTIESVSFMPGWGFAVAATTLVGQKVGEKDFKKSEEYAYTCTLLGIISMSICSVLFIIFPNQLIHLFINGSEKEVIQLGAKCLMIASIEQPFMAMSMILGGSLKGEGNTKTPFYISFISSWIIRLPLMFFFVYKLKLPVTNVWYITAVQWSFEGVVMFIMFRKIQNKNKLYITQ